MKNSIRAFAVAASAIVGIFASNTAMGSTISKNIPGAVRHPVNQAAIAVGADSPDHHTHHRYYHHTTYRSHSSRTYSTHRHRVRHYRHHHS